MPILQLTHIRDVTHARDGAKLIAGHIRDLPNPPLYEGVQQAGNQSCTSATELRRLALSPKSALTCRRTNSC